MKHEKSLLSELTSARAGMMASSSLSQKAKLSESITHNLKTLFAVAENYPKLAASSNFLKLQARMSALENEIADRREFFNDSANNYNIRIHSFPDIAIATLFRFASSELFKAGETEKQNVSVKI